MKRILRVIIYVLILFLFKGDSNAYGQKIIEYSGDTLVAITQEQLGTINSIIVEREYLIEELSLADEMNELMDSMIKEQEEIIKYGQRLLKDETEKHVLEIQDQAYQLKSEYRGKLFSWASVSLGFGLILGLLLK